MFDDDAPRIKNSVRIASLEKELEGLKLYVAGQTLVAQQVKEQADQGVLGLIADIDRLAAKQADQALAARQQEDRSDREIATLSKQIEELRLYVAKWIAPKDTEQERIDVARLDVDLDQFVAKQDDQAIFIERLRERVDYLYEEKMKKQPMQEAPKATEQEWIDLADLNADIDRLAAKQSDQATLIAILRAKVEYLEGGAGEETPKSIPTEWNRLIEVFRIFSESAQKTWGEATKKEEK